MESLLAILLYLQVVTVGGTYTDCEIYELENQHIEEVEAIRNDPVLYNQVQDEYSDDAATIFVIDESVCQVMQINFYPFSVSLIS